MHIYEKEFDFVIQRAKSLDRPARMVVAGADCENIMKAVFEAEAQGFCQPILVGFKERIIPMLKEYWFDNEDKFNKQAEKLRNSLS